MGGGNGNEDYIPLKPAFVGGAERARRNARKRMNQPRSNSNGGGYHGANKKNKRRSWQADNTISPYPKSMREYDRFFGSLLSSSVTSLKQSETDTNAHGKVMQQACSLLSIPSIPSPLYSSNKSKDGDAARTHHLLQRSSSCLSTASYSSTATTMSASSSSSSGTFDNARSYYMANAPLVLEESRCIVADSLTKISHNKKRGSGDNGSFTLQLISIEEKYPKVRNHAPLILNFQIINEPTVKRGAGNNNDKKSKSGTRPGSILLLHRKQQKEGKEGNNEADSYSSVLACIAPRFPSDAKVLSLMIFRREDLNLSQSSNYGDNGDGGTSQSSNDGDDEESPVFFATPLTTLIGQVRQMEACLRMVKVSFMRKLLGQKSSTHIRFGSSDEDEEDEDEEVVGEVGDETNVSLKVQEGFYVDASGNSSNDGDEEGGEDGSCDDTLAGLLVKIPALNQTQERAAKRFLDSPKESLILVQGPPGTGKSTFLVNVICRRLANNPNARLLVTAPTNKAVTVLAERFLNVVNSEVGEDNLLCKCNAVLVGVEDKLISHTGAKNEAECISPDALSSSLRSIFVYTWIETVKNECLSLLESMKCIRDAKSNISLTGQCEVSLNSLSARAEKVKSKLSMSIPSERSVCNYAKNALQQLKAAAAAELWEESIQTDDLDCSSCVLQLEIAISHVEDLVKSLDDVDPTHELLATARVIFCTLSTAGASILKQTKRIDDLLIDEAAAATEPEICIPFHLRPQRMLAVGDPLQLPPTLMSRHASDLGLSTSMHERLMNEVGNEYFMLDHQYRMRADISRFPCSQFYDGKIMNGKNVSCKSYTSDIALPKKSTYSFINVRGDEYQMPGGSYANNIECMAVVELVQKIAARKVPGWHSTDKLRIITFYQGQVTLMRRLLYKHGLGKVLVATVDSSQGCEADVVIISFVRSSSKKGVRHATGFLADDRRINVALTRARHQLICVGDAHGTLGQQGSETLKSLVADTKQRGCLV